jgi:hypothetical protein
MKHSRAFLIGTTSLGLDHHPRLGIQPICQVPISKDLRLLNDLLSPSGMRQIGRAQWGVQALGQMYVWGQMAQLVSEESQVRAQVLEMTWSL